MTVDLTALVSNLETNYDYLRVYDGNSDGDPSLLTHTGPNNFGTVSSTGNTMFVKFTSDYSVTRIGIKAVYSAP